MNYKELCSKLGVIYDNKNKKRQLEKLRKEYNIIEHDKNNYEIINKLSEVEILENNKSMKKNKLYLEPLIYTYLLKQDDNTIEKKLSDLLQCFAMVNKDYYFAKYESYFVDKMLNSHSGVELFIKESEPYLKRILYDVLIDMEDRCLITLDYVPHACYKYKFDDGKKDYTKDVKISDNPNLYEKYMECFRLAMNEKGYDKKSKIKWYDIMPIRYRTAELLECNYIYFAYKIVINKHGIQDYILHDFYGVRDSSNKYMQGKIKNKKYNDLMDDELDAYIDYFINIKSNHKIKENTILFKREYINSQKET